MEKFLKKVIKELEEAKLATEINIEYHQHLLDTKEADATTNLDLEKNKKALSNIIRKIAFMSMKLKSCTKRQKK